MKLTNDEQKFVKNLKDQEKTLAKVRELKAQAKTKTEVKPEVKTHDCDQQGQCVFESKFMGGGFHVNVEAVVEQTGQTKADVYLAISRCVGEANAQAIEQAVELGHAAGIDDPTLSDMIEAVLDAIHNVADKGRIINRLRKLGDE